MSTHYYEGIITQRDINYHHVNSRSVDFIFIFSSAILETN
jgi:hypothetical protein